MYDTFYFFYDIIICEIVRVIFIMKKSNLIITFLYLFGGV